MLEIATILSKNFPQVRVDLYNINGKIYFGEMTFTSNCGYMTFFGKALLQEMGDLVTLDYNLPGNMFLQNRKNEDDSTQ